LAIKSGQVELCADYLKKEFRAWRLGMQSVLQRLAENPGSGGQVALRARLNKKRERLEVKIKDALNKSGEGAFSDQNAE